LCEIKIKPYKGHIEKLKEPIELKGRVIKYKPVAKLGVKKAVQKGGLQSIAKKYIDIKCNNLGKNNTLVTGKNHALDAQEFLKKKLEEYIEKIDIKENFLRIYLNDIGQSKAEIVRTIADRIVGCNARLIQNNFHYNKTKETPPPPPNTNTPLRVGYVGNFIPPNNNISKTFL
jgi:hypothetical protein